MSTTVRTDKHAAFFQTIKPGKCQKIDFTNTSKQSTAFASTTTLIRVFPTQDCFVKIGANPTAVAAAEGSTVEDTIFLPGGLVDFIGVEPGEKIAVVRNATSGTLHITEAQ